MSFSFFKASRPKTPQEVVKEIKDSLMALDTKTVVEVKVLHKMGTMDQVLQLALEVFKEDVLSLMILKLPNLGWEARNDLVHCWSILLKQKVDSRYCSVEYVENHFEFLDFLAVCLPEYCHVIAFSAQEGNKDSSKNIKIAAFHIFKVFVANPSKPRKVKMILAKNHEKLSELLYNLSAGKGAEDEQFDVEKELIIKEIDKLSRRSNLDP